MAVPISAASEISAALESAGIRFLPKSSPGSTAAPPGAQSGEIFEEVSSLVEELEAARARAIAAGGRLPRAVEAAATALEPLLRLRDVTGALACDLSLMPWLPQLLVVFRNVLHTAVDGVGAKGGIDVCDVPVMSCADSGAGGMPNAAAAATAAAISAMAALGSAGADGGEVASPTNRGYVDSLMHENQGLRKRLQQQDAQLIHSRQSELSLRQQTVELRRARDQLAQKVHDLEARTATAEAIVMMTGSPSTGSNPGTAGHRPRADSAGSEEAELLRRRCSELEAENRAFRAEARSAEDQMADLTKLISEALEDEPLAFAAVETSSACSEPSSPPSARSQPEPPASPQRGRGSGVHEEGKRGSQASGKDAPAATPYARPKKGSSRPSASAPPCDSD